MGEVLTIGMAWDTRPETARECAERLAQSVTSVPAQRDLYSEWLVMPQGGAASPTELLPLPDDLTELTTFVEDSRLKNDRGQIMEGSGFSFTLARLHHERPVVYRVRCNVERETTGNYVQFDFPHPDHADPAVGTGQFVEAAFEALVHAWEPRHAAASTFSFRKAQRVNRRANEVTVGWLTFLSDATTLDASSLPATVQVSHSGSGIYLQLSGSPMEPSIDDALAVRQALGYEND